MRPSKLNETTQENIVTALMTGATHEIAAAFARIDVSTFYNWKKRGKAVYNFLEQEEVKKAERAEEIAAAKKAKSKDVPKPYKAVTKSKLPSDDKAFLEFFEAIQEAESVGAINHLQNLDAMKQIDPKVSMWLLQNRYGYGREPQKVEVTGANGGAIETKDTTERPSVNETAAAIVTILQTARSRKEDDNGDDSSTG